MAEKPRTGNAWVVFFSTYHVLEVRGSVKYHVEDQRPGIEITQLEYVGIFFFQFFFTHVDCLRGYYDNYVLGPRTGSQFSYMLYEGGQKIEKKTYQAQYTFTIKLSTQTQCTQISSYLNSEITKISSYLSS